MNIKTIALVVILAILGVTTTFFAYKYLKTEVQEFASPLQTMGYIRTPEVKQSTDNWNISEKQIASVAKFFDKSAGMHLRSSSWFKPVAVNGCSDTYLFPTPYVVKLSQNAIEIGVQKMNASENTLFMQKDVSLKISIPFEVTDCSVLADGQLGAIINLKSIDKEIKLHLVKGSTQIFIEDKGVDLKYEGKSESDFDKYKIIIGNDDSEFLFSKNIEAGYSLLALSPKDYNKKSFIECLNAKPQSPEVKFGIKDDKVIQQFIFKEKTPYVLLPHQYQNYAKNDANNYGVTGIMGDLKFVCSESIELSYDLENPQIFPAVELTTDQKEILSKQLEEDIQNYKDDISNMNEGVYWKGKTLAKYTNLMYVADLVGNQVAYENLQTALKNEFDDLFKYSGEDDQKYFSYDREAGSLISNQPEYGHEDLNDHHFHYGYYLYALSYLASNDEEFYKKYAEIVSYLIRDTASFDLNDKSFPYLRYFDLYDGRSNASGLVYMADGNNQESTSEAINFWYAAYMWNVVAEKYSDENAKILKNDMLAGYTLEILSVNFYNFNTGLNPSTFPESYKHTMKSILFEGKHDFATWFTADANAIHGIQVIPVTLASAYLKNPEFAKKNYESQKSLAKDENTWVDMTSMYLIINGDQRGFEMLDKITSFDSGNSKTWSNFLKFHFN